MKTIMQKYLEGELTKKTGMEPLCGHIRILWGNYRGSEEGLMSITLEQESLLVSAPKAFWQELPPQG